MRRGAIVVASAMVLAGCGGSGSTAPGGGATRELVVSAAASLTDVFEDLGAAFEAANPGVTVSFNFGPSDGLATQIVEGAPVDVFASASPAWMDAVQRRGPGVVARADFASNVLAVIVPRDGSAGLATLDDLGDPDVKLVIAAEGVPAGDYAREVLANAGIAPEALANVVSNAEDVRAVVTAVAMGEADAGIVYVTDVTPDVADLVRVIAIPDDVNVTATYPIAVVTGSGHMKLARAFVGFVLADGQETLAEHGFLPAD